MILSYLIKILEWGRLGLNTTLLCTTPRQNAQRNALSKNSTSGHFRIFGCVYKPIEKNKIPVVRGLKTKRKKLHVEQKVKKKTVSFENSFIFLVLDFCTKGFSGFTSAENDVWSL